MKRVEAMNLSGLNEQFREALKSRLEDLGLLEEKARFLTLDSNFVRLPSREYALMRGKEFIEHCEVRGCCGQAFTDRPRETEMRLKDVLRLNLEDVTNRALFFSALNAVMRLSGEVKRVIHCVKREAEECGEVMAREILERYGRGVRVAHIGYQPSHVEALSKLFKVYVTDMNPENVGKVKFGVRILDSSLNREVISKADVVLITGSSLINNTLFELLDYCRRFRVPHLIYGITAIGVAKIMGLQVFCPFAHESMPEGWRDA